MHDTVFLGRISVRPPLNEAERDYLTALADSNSTLRGTPTGRGDATVPFARLAWEPCPTGCCLTWSGRERTTDMQPSLRFLVDHLLRAGAKATGHRRFPGFTCDHVLDGCVVGWRHDDAMTRVVEVSCNRIVGRSLEAGCGTTPQSRPAAARARPDNVIEFRPRRA